MSIPPPLTCGSTGSFISMVYYSQNHRVCKYLPYSTLLFDFLTVIPPCFRFLANTTTPSEKESLQKLLPKSF